MRTKTVFAVLLMLVLGLTFAAQVRAHDVNGDGYANWYDLKRVSLCFGQHGEPGWIPEDVNVDGKVDMKDIGLVAKQIQETPVTVKTRPHTLLVPPEDPEIEHIFAFIRLPEANVEDIDVNSIDWVMPGIGYPMFVEGAESGIVIGKTMMATFRANRIIEYLRVAYPTPGLYEVRITIAGVVLPGTLTFMGTELINVRVCV